MPCWQLLAETPAGDIERFRTDGELDGGELAGAGHVARPRRLLVENAAAYLERGDAAIGPISDRRKPVDSGAEFRGLLSNLACDRGAAPDFFRYLADYPKNQPADADEFHLLVEGDVRHEAGHQPDARASSTGRTPGAMLIATKGLLSNHYLDASLGLTLLVPAGRRGSPAIDLVYVNRSRADALGGLFGASPARLSPAASVTAPLPS